MFSSQVLHLRCAVLHVCLQVVLHCWGGSGRTGAAAAACLAAQHGLTVEEAAQRVEAAAQKLGTNRRVNVATAQKLVNQLQQ